MILRDRKRLIIPIAATACVLAVAVPAGSAAVKGSLEAGLSRFAPPKTFDGVGHTTQPVRPTYHPIRAEPVKVRASQSWFMPDKRPQSVFGRTPDNLLDLIEDTFDGEQAPGSTNIFDHDLGLGEPTRVNPDGRFPGIAPGAADLPRVPAPGAALVLGLGALGCARRRR